MNFISKAIPMTRAGLAEALSQLGFAPTQAAALWSVFEVETGSMTQGFGFRADRRPQILFERHKFREFTDGKFNQSDPDISGPQGAYGPLAIQYDKLERALALCDQNGLGVEPALKSASWGIGQVMGFNHAVAGYPSAQKMVEAMVLSEDNQLFAMAGYLEANDLARHLKNQDWAKFARGYNGKSFAQNQYDVKLEQAYARFSSGSMPDLEMRTAQAALLLLGFGPGKIDGVLGNRTRGALKAFQTANGLPVIGDLDATSYGKLFAVAFG
jgi:N-acetylmuramidase/Putative peptidoglycan binding domain